MRHHPTRGRLHYPRVLEQPVPKDPSKVKMIKRKRAQLEGGSAIGEKPAKISFNDIVDIFIYSKPSSERISLTQSKQKSVRKSSNDYP